MLINKISAVHCLFMLVHSALIMLTYTTFDFSNVLVNVEMNINLDK